MEFILSNRALKNPQIYRFNVYRWMCTICLYLENIIKWITSLILTFPNGNVYYSSIIFSQIVSQTISENYLIGAKTDTLSSCQSIWRSKKNNTHSDSIFHYHLFSFHTNSFATRRKHTHTHTHKQTRLHSLQMP